MKREIALPDDFIIEFVPSREGCELRPGELCQRMQIKTIDTKRDEIQARSNAQEEWQGDRGSQ